MMSIQSCATAVVMEMFAPRMLYSHLKSRGRGFSAMRQIAVACRHGEQLKS